MGHQWRVVGEWGVCMGGGAWRVGGGGASWQSSGDATVVCGPVRRGSSTLMALGRGVPAGAVEQPCWHTHMPSWVGDREPLPCSPLSPAPPRPRRTPHLTLCGPACPPPPPPLPPGPPSPQRHAGVGPLVDEHAVVGGNLLGQVGDQRVLAAAQPALLAGCVAERQVRELAVDAGAHHLRAGGRAAAAA